MAGSYVLGSVARAVLILQPASNNTEDCRVVVTPAKNNDGEMGPRTAWERTQSGFEFLPDFDWEEYDGKTSKSGGKITIEHLEVVFGDGNQELSKKKAAEKLEKVSGAGRSTCYKALEPSGRFKDYLRVSADTELIRFRGRDSFDGPETDD